MNPVKYNKKKLFIIYLIFILLVIKVSANNRAQDNGCPFEIVEAFANTMIKNGRDVYGHEHSPLFAAAMDRTTMNPGSEEKFEKIPGVRKSDRSLGGANPQENMAFYSILYELTELTGNKKYAREADKALKFLFNHCQSSETDLICWGEHLYWDFYKDKCQGNDMHEIKGEWPFWDQSYRVASEASWRYSIGLWDHQINCKNTGDFSRHARYLVHETYGGFEFPRYAGQMILTWADAYIRDENANRKRRGELLNAISVIVGRMEDNMNLSESGYLIAGRAEKGDHVNLVWLPNNLELARCLWKAAGNISEVDKDLAIRMKELALKQDIDFHKAPHQITEGGGFVSTLHAKTGEPRHRSMNKPYTETWATGYGHSTHANMANLCYARYDQLIDTHPEIAEKYRKIIMTVAKQYLSARPDTQHLYKPAVFADIIEFMINTYNMTEEEKFLKRADYFSRIGVDLFLDDDVPLPKATNKHSHYEAITGGPDFMYALLRLATIQSIHDVQVGCN